MYINRTNELDVYYLEINPNFFPCRDPRDGGGRQVNRHPSDAAARLSNLAALLHHIKSFYQVRLVVLGGRSHSLFLQVGCRPYGRSFSFFLSSSRMSSFWEGFLILSLLKSGVLRSFSFSLSLQVWCRFGRSVSFFHSSSRCIR